jgi:hypothetical protein
MTTRLLLALLLLSSSGCLLGELLNPTEPPPPKKCYWGISRILPDGTREWLQGGEITCPTRTDSAA